MGWKDEQTHGRHRSWEDGNGCRRARDSPRRGGRSLLLLAEGEAAEGHGDRQGRKAGPVRFHRRELGSGRPWGWGANAEVGRERAEQPRGLPDAHSQVSLPPRAHTRGGALGTHASERPRPLPKSMQSLHTRAGAPFSPGPALWHQVPSAPPNSLLAMPKHSGLMNTTPVYVA